MLKLLQNKWTAVGLSLLLYGLVTALLLRPNLTATPAVPPTVVGADRVAKPAPSWDFKNPEFDQAVAELKTERAKVKEREEQLREFEARLNSEHQEIMVVTQAVYQLQTEIDQTILRVKEDEAVNLKKLAKVYATMTPEGAALILRELTDDQLVRVLVFTKDSETALILEALGKQEPKRAALVSNKLRLAARKDPGDKPKKS